MQHNFDMQQLMALAGSPIGQQLIEALKQTGSTDVEKAASLAASGNMDQARQTLSGLLSDPGIRALLQQLEGQL